MATPTYPSKRFYNAGIVQASTWGTATAMGATRGLVIPNDGKPALKREYAPTDAIGQVMPLDGDLGACEPVEWDIPFDGKCGFQYEAGALGSVVAGLFGASAAPAQQGGTSAYKHVFTWADEMTDFFTFATERPGDIWEIPSCVPKKLTLKVGDGKVQGSLSMVGNLLNNDSTVNTATEMDALTPAATANFVKFQHGVLWMNAQSDGALDSGDALVVSDFTIEFERLLDIKTVLGGAYMGQPKETGYKITVKITLPYASATDVGYLTTFNAMTAQKMTVVFTGGVADDTTHYTMTLGFPRLKFSAPPDVALEDVIKNQLEFVAEEASAAPTGMSAVRPWMELINLRSSNYLA